MRPNADWSGRPTLWPTGAGPVVSAPVCHSAAGGACDCGDDSVMKVPINHSITQTYNFSTIPYSVPKIIGTGILYISRLQSSE